jgi:hypothetical protein
LWKLCSKDVMKHELVWKGVLGLARLAPCHFSERWKSDGRYIILASQNNCTLLNRRLRWPESCWEASGSLRWFVGYKFCIYWDGSHTQTYLQTYIHTYLLISHYIPLNPKKQVSNGWSNDPSKTTNASSRSFGFSCLLQILRFLSDVAFTGHHLGSDATDRKTWCDNMWHICTNS